MSRAKDIATKSNVVTIDGRKYFVSANNYIEISEHFAENGKSLNELIEDVIIYTADSRKTA